PGDRSAERYSAWRAVRASAPARARASRCLRARWRLPAPPGARGAAVQPLPPGPLPALLRWLRALAGGFALRRKATPLRTRARRRGPPGQAAAPAPRGAHFRSAIAQGRRKIGHHRAGQAIARASPTARRGRVFLQSWRVLRTEPAAPCSRE